MKYQISPIWFLSFLEKKAQSDEFGAVSEKKLLSTLTV
jgi:hypothetical protein